jgi:hypothetical protein
MDEKYLKQVIRKILTEQETQDEPKKASPSEPQKKKSDTLPGEIGLSVGRGRWSKTIQEAGALAVDDPKQLMKNLKISERATGYNGVAKILDQALKSTETMRAAYKEISIAESGDKKGILIKMNELDNRNGAKYIQHVLVGAINSGMLGLNIPIQVDRIDDDSVVVYSSPVKNSWAS